MATEPSQGSFAVILHNPSVMMY